MRRLAAFISAAAIAVLISGPVDAQGAKPRVLLKTSMGEILIELEPGRAPKTVENFLQYVRDGHYDGTVFHRVIRGFMIQGGGFGLDLKRRPTRAPIANEADKSLPNDRGTIAMARTSDPHSATDQFYINTNKNVSLDHTAKTPRGWGYTTFGRVIDGMTFVRRIARVDTGRVAPFPSDVPLSPVIIEKATIVER